MRIYQVIKFVMAGAAWIAFAFGYSDLVSVIVAAYIFLIVAKWFTE